MFKLIITALFNKYHAVVWLDDNVGARIHERICFELRVCRTEHATLELASESL